MIEGGGHGFWGDRDEVYVGTGKVLYPVCHSGRGLVAAWLLSGYPPQHRVAVVTANVLVTLLQVFQTEGAT